MTKIFSIVIFLFLSFKVSFGQNTHDYYISITLDTSEGNRLKFLSDTTVELSSIPIRSGKYLRIRYNYVSTDTKIEIFPNPITKGDTTTTVFNMKLPILKTKLTLTKIKHGFINNEQSIIYVRRKDFPHNPKITYIIDGKTYKQDMVVTDRYGIIGNKPKINKSLQKRLNTIDKNHCTVKTFKGLAAYENFGIDKVYGVIVINTLK